MGYLYRGSSLVCDECGDAGAKKRKCPWGWCKPTALCAECWEKYKKDWRKLHLEAGCKKNHEEYAAKEKLQAELMASGKFLRVSALNSKREDRKVKVIFRSKDDVEKAFFMSHDAYDSIPIGTPAIIEDYEKFETLEPATNLDIYSPL